MTNEQNSEQTFRGLKSAAAFARVSVATVRKWMASGRLKYSRPSGNIIIFTKEQLETALYGTVTE
jgi:predicted site-specific integrase-resolvase